jgi:uncharacterized Zn finger protein (UPF0148 family)
MLDHCEHCGVPTFITAPDRPWICGNCGKRNEPREPPPRRALSSRDAER